MQSAKGAKTWEKAEDPIFALENNLPIDFQHYVEHHLALPLMRIFEPIMRNPKSLLSGLQLHRPVCFDRCMIMTFCLALPVLLLLALWYTSESFSFQAIHLLSQPF